ncbi:ABC transporter ATP-binding protein [Desulfotomaculum copahuensis]|uniref:ABC transporter ATP-binding protein n=1 Tax=Desulfotomaculum copahuensis TaxID=1838280 RepID=A0A1B7LEA0_9FIRM|nr:ABC transporter ATP-binding protein [Desulfotomaculum copahuensis]OAT81384.1 ABC transporter ATP-binding protein [Desulfotomaculum copahuensis]
MLRVNHVHVAYGDVHILWDVSFSVGEGELVALLGANGAGKTTMLNSISGLLHPQEGEIEFSGRNITRVPGHKIPALGIAHVPEGRRLFPEMTVKENLEIGSLSPPARQKRKETLEWVFTLFPVLKEKQNQMAGTLSGGQQQMLAIGRGLMALPRLIMFDEPSLGLAPVLVKHMFQLIKDINQQGITVLLVEQNVMQVLEVCHRAYVIENGRIVLSGASAELLNNKYIKDVYLGI